MMTAPNTYDSRAGGRTARRMSLAGTSGSETWKVSPAMNVR